MTELSAPSRSSLIVVCCHAIYLGSSRLDLDAGINEDEDWLLEPFQRGETPTFIQHIKAGVLQLKTSLDRGDDAVLVFSGGATKRSKGCAITEGESYQNLALARNLFGLDTKPPSLRNRVFAETYATDSYQNILLSLIQYPLFTHTVAASRKVYPSPSSSTPWPHRLIIVSHAFKQSRFLNLHMPAIAAPVKETDYIGIDPPLDADKLAEVIRGDKLRGYSVWKHDVYGTGDVLRSKRLQRGWDEATFIHQVLELNDSWSPSTRTSLAAIVRSDNAKEWPQSII